MEDISKKLDRNLKKIKNCPSLRRDPYSKAIVNTDRSALNSYLERKKKIEERNAEQTQEINSLKNEIIDLKRELQDIRGIFKEWLLSQ